MTTYTYTIRPLSENRLYKYAVFEIKDFDSEHTISRNTTPIGMFMNLYDAHEYIAERKQRNREVRL